jgi:hypothetical protein
VEGEEEGNGGDNIKREGETEGAIANPKGAALG